MGPSDGHTYLGDFVKEGGYADETKEAFSELLDGEKLCRPNIFSTDPHELLTRHRGMLLGYIYMTGRRQAGPKQRGAGKISKASCFKKQIARYDVCVS